MGKKSKYSKRRKRKKGIPRNPYSAPKCFKLHANIPIRTGSSGLISFNCQVNSMVNALQQNGGTTVPMSNYAQIHSLFDVYKIRGVKLEWFPRHNSITRQVLVGNTSTGAASLNDVSNNPLMAIAYDPDSLAGSETFQAMIQRNRVRVANVSDKLSHYQKVKPTIQGDTTLTGGWLDIAQDIAGNNLNGVIWMKTEEPLVDSSAATLPLYEAGNLFVTYWMEAKVTK